ncbi:MAG: hypothetical protein ABIW76_22110 [Fibrobacteria bacterium]
MTATRWTVRLVSAAAYLSAIACLAAALSYIGAFLWVALCRLGYPYELEWMEGGVLIHVQRVLAGQPLYVAPALDFVPFLYTPLYYYLAAPLTWLHEGFLPLRALSLLCAAPTLAVLYLWIQGRTQSRLAASLGAGFYGAAFSATGFWYDLARVDSLFILALLSALWSLDGPAKNPRLLASALLFAVAFQCKQSSLMVIACMAPMYLGGGRKRLAFSALALAAGIPGMIWILDRAHHGWYAYYVFGLPSHHAILKSAWLGFWTRDTLTVFPLAFLAGAVALAGRFRQGDARGTLFLVTGTTGMLSASYVSRLHVGGWDNVLMPAFAWLSLLTGLGIGTLERSWNAECEAEARTFRRTSLSALAVYAACLLQFIRFAYDPRKQIPDGSDLVAGGRTEDWIRRTPGEVFIPDHGYLAQRAGKPPFAHRIAIEDVLRGPEHPARKALEVELASALESGRFSALLMDSEQPSDAGILPDTPKPRYRRTKTLPYGPREFMPRTGIKSRPEFVFEPWF